MRDIREILKELEIHDSTIDSVTINGDGSVELFLDIDDVWNKDIGSNITGIRFKSVYELSDFKIDRLNIIGSIEVEFIEGYNTEFVTHINDESEKVSMVSFELVAGGSLNIICSGLAEII